MTSSVVVTPKVSQRLRGSRSLISIGLIALISGALFLLIPQDEFDTVPLSPANPGPRGARALAQVLEDLGAEVIYAADASEAIAEAKLPNTTLVITQPDLMSSEIDEAAAELGRVVGIGSLPPGDSEVFPGLETLTTGTTPDLEDAVAVSLETASCASPSARAAQSATAGRRHVFSASAFMESATGVQPGQIPGRPADWEWCFLVDDSGDPFLSPDDQGSAGAIYAEKWQGETYRAVIANDLLATNEWIAREGNATLMLNALTAPAPRDDLGRIVWYRASLTDTLRPVVPGAPSWLVPVSLLLIGATLFLAVAQGRRLGRLVPEDLPSYVPAAETITGRGRLLRRQGQRAHAAHHLRVATARRLATRLGVPEGEDPEMLRSALRGAGVSDTDSQWLWSPEPATDDDLVEVASRLAAIEEEIRNVRH
ncbi:DUF4350 domain-containing protein [Schaalia sp. Marseille-Q2122]|uniref:DUF4350 domain-containing protein n=1 Tax=Schaalia sp. Marseille-Q2122 TaxID=2736604 RepID=UPI00158E69C8|nr:DUF4350 domain-containing protein [Schaalia sp. Marseille-Q2122]